MSYLYEIPNMTAGTGLDETLVSTQASVPVFIPMFLLFVFGFVLISGYIQQNRRTGSADFSMWTVLASICTLLVALPMTLVAGLLSLDWLVIVVIVNIFAGLWFFMDRNKNEV